MGLHSSRDQHWGFPCGSTGKESACNAGDLGLTPGLGRFLGEGNGNPLQYSLGEFHGQRSLVGYSPWDSPGKNTGVGCHFLLQCMKVNSESEVAQSCPTLSDPMDCSLPGSSVHGIFQARVLEWGAISFSENSAWNI